MNRFALLAAIATVSAFCGCNKSSGDSGPLGPDASLPAQVGADAAAPVCVDGPNGWCWWLYENHPSNKAAWVAPPSAASAHASLTSGPEAINLQKAGMGFSVSPDGQGIDLSLFDRIVFRAKAFSPFEFNVSNPESTAGCTSTFLGSGVLQTYEQSFSTCVRWNKPPQPAFDFTSVHALDWATPWGKASTVNIEIVPDILFCRGNECTTNPLQPPSTTKLDADVPVTRPDTGAAPTDTAKPLADAAAPSADTAPSCGTAAVPAGQSPDDVTFLNGEARGPLHGWTWPAWGKLESVTGVTCLPGTYDPQVHGHPCSERVTWSPGNALCLSGSVPALPQESLNESWGLAIGVDANMCNGTIGRTYSTIAVSATGIPPEAIQAGVWLVTVHVSKEGGGTLYYAKDTGEGKPIPFSQFNTTWWDPAAGVYLKAQDVANIDQVTVSVMASTSRTISVSNLCLSKISFGAAGGSPDAGASTDAPSTTSSVTFSNGKPSGAMNGWAWPTMGQDEVITEPLCQPNLVPPTASDLCSTGVKWNSPTQLCLSGSTPAAVTDLDYSLSWGMGIAVSVGETEATPLGQSYSTMAFQVSGVPSNVLSRGRFVVGVHRAGDPASTMYLVANNGLGQPVRLTDMNTAWWDTAQGVFLQPADVPKIDRVEIDVMADSVPFTVSNLCLSGIVFGK